LKWVDGVGFFGYDVKMDFEVEGLMWDDGDVIFGDVVKMDFEEEGLVRVDGDGFLATWRLTAIDNESMGAG